MNLLYREKSVPLAGYFEEADSTIFVSEGLPPLIAECVYLHELEHKKCFESGCECYSEERDDDKELAEWHAFRGELMAVLERDSVALAQTYLRGVQNTLRNIARNPRLWRSHGRAVARIIRLKAYRQVQDLAGGIHFYPGEKK